MQILKQEHEKVSRYSATLIVVSGSLVHIPFVVHTEEHQLLLRLGLRWILVVLILRWLLLRLLLRWVALRILLRVWLGICLVRLRVWLPGLVWFARASGISRSLRLVLLDPECGPVHTAEKDPGENSNAEEELADCLGGVGVVWDEIPLLEVVANGDHGIHEPQGKPEDAADQERKNGEL